MAEIEILLSTYNGEQFLPDLLASLTAQTYAQQGGDWSLVIRDDASIDRTWEVIAQFLDQNPGRVRLLGRGEGNLGAARSFSRLMQEARAPYVMFCDQDDVWLPHKVARTLEAMRALENRYAPGRPLLVHTDLEVVDEELNRISPSFWAYQSLKPEYSQRLERMLMTNYITGCTMMVNRAAVRLASPVPPECGLHDRWMGLVCTACGVVDFIPEATILYRQHGDNDTGAKRFDLDYIWDRMNRCLERDPAARRPLQEALNRAIYLRERYPTRIIRDRLAQIEGCIRLLRQWRILRPLTLLRTGLRHASFLRTLGLLLFPPLE